MPLRGVGAFPNDIFATLDKMSFLKGCKSAVISRQPLKSSGIYKEPLKGNCLLLKSGFCRAFYMSGFTELQPKPTSYSSHKLKRKNPEN